MRRARRQPRGDGTAPSTAAAPTPAKRPGGRRRGRAPKPRPRRAAPDGRTPAPLPSIGTRRCRRASTSPTRSSSARTDFLIGDATYRFEHADNRYRIPPSARRAGLAALLLRGQGKLESRGLITAEGLQPLEFASSAASRTAARRRVSTGKPGIVTLHEDKTAPIDTADVRPAVADVAVLLHAADARRVAFTLATHAARRRATRSPARATETIAWGSGAIDAERWHRRSDDGKTDAYVWLAPWLRYMPVKMRVSNWRGTVEVVLDAIRVDRAARQRRLRIPRRTRAAPQPRRESAADELRRARRSHQHGRDGEPRAGARRDSPRDRECAASTCPADNTLAPLLPRAPRDRPARSRVHRRRRVRVAAAAALARSARRSDRSAPARARRRSCASLDASLRDLDAALKPPTKRGCASSSRGCDDPLPPAVAPTCPTGCGNAWATPMATPSAIALARAWLTPAPLDLRVNPLKTTRDEALAALAATASMPRATPYSPLGIRIDGRPALARHPLARRRPARSAGRRQPAHRLRGRAAAQRNGRRLLRGRRRQDAAARRADALAAGGCTRSTSSQQRLANLKPRLARSGLSNVHPATARAASATPRSSASPARSTACWSTRRAPASARCAAIPTSSGGSPRARSPSSRQSRRRSSPRRRRS